MQGVLLSCLMISDWPLESGETIIGGEYHLKIHHVMKDMKKDQKVQPITFLVRQ